MSSELLEERRAQQIEDQLNKIGGVALDTQIPAAKKNLHIVASDSHQQRVSGRRQKQQQPDLRNRDDARSTFRTFGLEKCREIDRNNLLLVKNLAAISLRQQPIFRPTLKPKVKKEGRGKSSMSMNRRKTGDRIARENLAFAERLARIQGTRELSSDVMRKEAQLQRKYVKQCRRKKDLELELW